MLIKSSRTTWEIELLGCRDRFINTALTGSAYARVEAKHWGRGWFDAWWNNDEKTCFVLSVGKWSVVWDLPAWIFRGTFRGRVRAR